MVGMGSDDDGGTRVAAGPGDPRPARPPGGRPAGGRGRRRWPAPLALLGAAGWMTAWGLAVRSRTGPLAVDRQVAAALAVDQHWQDLGIRLLRLEGPATWVAATGVLAVAALAAGSWRAALASLAGVAAEVASVQWVAKPLVGRHELAPGLSFPSSHVGAVTAVATVAVVVLGARGPLGRRLPPAAAAALGRIVAVLAVADVAVVAVAVLATGGHLFSDVAAVVPWGVAVPAAAFAALRATPPAATTIPRLGR